MNCIVAVDENWDIGKNGGLLTHLPGDLKYFKERTLGTKIIIGRKTLESFPGGRPLPGRENIVLTQNREYQAEGCTVLHSREELEAYLGDDTKDVFLCGGETLYREFLEDCEVFYVTKIFAAFGGDKSFPCLDGRKDLEITWKSEIQKEKGLEYQFLEYRRK